MWEERIREVAGIASPERKCGRWGAWGGVSVKSVGARKGLDLWIRELAKGPGFGKV